ncbi:molecular chaperone GrpE [Dysgonomonadaceae bacterium PH5-43]|nr:molecular chaperone GrpE [Dysgonomonadaceae bacterium PH5-43]
MDKKEQEKKVENNDNLTDNLIDEVSKQQEEDTTQEENTVETDNEADELAQLKDSYVRLMAEYDNYRKRTIKEKADLIKSGGEKVLIGLLSVVDDFERALDNINKTDDINGLKEGVELIHSKFINFLQQNGVKAMQTVGEPFNEDLFEAVAMVPAQDKEQEGMVIDDVQKGYTLNDKVIRYAKVVVAN